MGPHAEDSLPKLPVRHVRSDLVDGEDGRVAGEHRILTPGKDALIGVVDSQFCARADEAEQCLARDRAWARRFVRGVDDLCPARPGERDGATQGDSASSSGATAVVSSSAASRSRPAMQLPNVISTSPPLSPISPIGPTQPLS